MITHKETRKMVENYISATIEEKNRALRRKPAETRPEHDMLKKCRGLLRESPKVKYRLIKGHSERPVAKSHNREITIQHDC